MIRENINPLNMIISNKKYIWSMYYEKDENTFLFIRSFDGNSFKHKISNGKTSTKDLIDEYEKNDPNFKDRDKMYKTKHHTCDRETQGKKTNH